MREELSINDPGVTGEIPASLGKYARIGPNPFNPDPRGHHWFVGDGMVHGIRISDGKAMVSQPLHQSGNAREKGRPNCRRWAKAWGQRHG